MSPAYSNSKDDVFSWVGIIMYLPTEDADQRRLITKDFFQYFRMTEQLRDKYNAQEHWAKIEMPTTFSDMELAQARIRSKYPVDLFNKKRNELDPGHVLSNHLIDTLFRSSV